MHYLQLMWLITTESECHITVVMNRKFVYRKENKKAKNGSRTKKRLDTHRTEKWQAGTKFLCSK